MASKRFGLTGIKADIADARRRLTITRKKLATQELDDATRAQLTQHEAGLVAWLDKTLNGER